MWSALNAAGNGVIGLLLAPLAGLGWFWQVLVLAVPLTVLALLAFRFCSPQARIRRARRLIQAYLLEMRLFRDDLRVVARAQGRILVLALRYMLYALPPLAVMLVPMVMVLAQVEARFAYRPFAPGERGTLVVAQDGLRADSDVRLELPSGLVAETDALRMPARGEVRWLLRAEALGVHQARVHFGVRTLDLQVRVGGPEAGPLPTVYRGDTPLALLAPHAPALATDGTVSTMRLEYPRAGLAYAGLSGAAWGLFGLSMVLGLALRGRFGVAF